MVYFSRKKAFTLIELLIALVVLSFIAIISFRAMDGFLTTKQTVTTQLKNIDQLMRSLSVIEQDLLHALPQNRHFFCANLFVTRALPTHLPFLSFVRHAKSYLGKQKAPFRVSYLFQPPNLIRRVEAGENVYSDMLLDNLYKIDIKFFSQDVLVWRSFWDIPEEQESRCTPSIVSMKFFLKGMEPIEKLFLLPIGG